MTSPSPLRRPEFQRLKDNLDSERKNIFKVQNISHEEDDYVRSVEDAAIILDFLVNVFDTIYNAFKDNVSLLSFFDEEYADFQEFFAPENIMDVCFIEDCLFPEKESFYFGQDGDIGFTVLDVHLNEFKSWSAKVLLNHLKCQKFIEEELNISIKLKEISCQCQQCRSVFRTKLREIAYDEAIADIEATTEIVLNEEFGLSHVCDQVQLLRKRLDKRNHKIRFQLRKSTINRLEYQVKQKFREALSYPSEAATVHIKRLSPVLKHHLYDNNVKEELIDENDFYKFYKSIETNLYRNEGYLIREFKKLVKSILMLKRKDISGTILQEYLGEFWVHSLARPLKRKIIYHMGPTNSGKTYHAIEALAAAKTGCYLAPLRLLAGELYDTLNQKGVTTTLLTGEEVIETENATHYSSTIEMARLNQTFDSCVIDEIQMITDPQRGWAWTRALVNIVADEIHLCGDPSVLDLVRKIVELCGDELEIKEYQRMTKLKVMRNPMALSELERSDALIVFSRRNALKYKMDLENLGFKVSIVYGRLSPEVRREQARKFDQGETDIMVSTDAIAMGMNLPIKRIIFSTLSKFFNSQEYPITESEIKQIAGRAGRYKRFPTGFTSCLSRVEDGLDQIKSALDMDLDQKTKCMVGPDLDIFSQVNHALEENGLDLLRLSEFLRLFNTMDFQKPFYCVDLKEMIELAETVEDADQEQKLSSAEVFGFACAPVNMGLMDHVQYYVAILNNFVASVPVKNFMIESSSSDIDYLETSIKCVELYQWLARHFNGKNFIFDETELLDNKLDAVAKLNGLLSEKIMPTCSSCGCKLPEKSKFAICEECFEKRKTNRRGPSRRRPNHKKTELKGKVKRKRRFSGKRK